MKSLLQKIRKGEGEPENSTDRLMEKAFESLPREGGAFRVLRRDDRGQLKMLDVLPRDSVQSPDELLALLQENWGGGRYYVIPTKAGKKIAEGFPVEFDSEPKKTKKKANADDKAGEKRTGKQTEIQKTVAELREELRELKEKDREDRLVERLREEFGKKDGNGEVVNSILKNFPQIVTGLSGLLGNRESAADMLEKISTIWTNVERSMPQTDPIAQAKDMADLIFTIVNQAKPPISATGPTQQTGSGLSSFFASVIAELEKRYVGALGTMSGAGLGPALAGPGFSGSPDAEQQPATEKPAKTDQPQDILAGFNLKSLGVDPEATLRQLLVSRDDPANVGEVIAYLLNFIKNFAAPDSAIALYIQTFFDNPGTMFDQVAPQIPELRGASEKYLRDLRAAIVREVGAYAREHAEQTAAAGAEKGEEKTLTPQQREAQKASRESEQAVETVEDAGVTEGA